VPSHEQDQSPGQSVALASSAQHAAVCLYTVHSAEALTRTALTMLAA